MDVSHLKPLELDDAASFGVGGSSNSFDYRTRRGIVNGQIIPLDAFADNIDFLNRLGEDTRWMMVQDKAVPYDYRWTASLSLGKCMTIGHGRTIADAHIFAQPLAGRTDFVLVNHVTQLSMEVFALFEFEDDAVYHVMAA